MPRASTTPLASVTFCSSFPGSYHQLTGTGNFLNLVPPEIPAAIGMVGTGQRQPLPQERHWTPKPECRDAPCPVNRAEMRHQKTPKAAACPHITHRCPQLWAPFLLAWHGLSPLSRFTPAQKSHGGDFSTSTGLALAAVRRSGGRGNIPDNSPESDRRKTRAL